MEETHSVHRARTSLVVANVSIFLIIVLILPACASDRSPTEGNEGSVEEKVLNVFNWSEMIPDSVIAKFEEENGIQVNYNTFSSNEEMYAKLSAGSSGYDIVNTTPDYVEMLIKVDKLERINMDNIPNIKNVGSEYFGNFADPNNEYTVPHTWGLYMLAVNDRLVDVSIEHYKDLLDPSLENSLAVVDDPRPVIGMMLITLGYSPNSTDEQEIQEAGELLKKLKPNVKVFDPDPKNLLSSEEVKAGITYTGDAALAMRENPDIKMVFPEEGILAWLDNYVIPKDAPHKVNAETFLNFVQRPEIMEEIIVNYPYGTSNEETLKLLPQEIKEEINFVEEFKRGEFLRDVGEATVLYDRIWTEFKDY